MSETSCEKTFAPEARVAWLEIGGYVAGADGLSDDEVQALAYSASGPEIDKDGCITAIKNGASWASLDASALKQVEGEDPFFKVQCLLEVFAAAAHQEMVESEWARLREVANELLGGDKSADFIRLCEIQKEAADLRARLMFG